MIHTHEVTGSIPVTATIITGGGMNNNIAKNLLRLRTEKGLSSKAVAKMLDVEEKEYASWEMGVKIPEVDDILKIADAYSIDYAILLDEPKEVPTKSSTTATNVQKSKVKAPKIVFGLRIAALILCLGMFGILAIPFFAGSELGGFLQYEFGFYYLLANGNAANQAVTSLIIVFLGLFIIDYVVRTSLPREVPSYNRVSNVLSIIVGPGFLACTLAFICGPVAKGVVNVDGRIVPLILMLLALVGVILAERILALINDANNGDAEGHNKKEKAQKPKIKATKTLISLRIIAVILSAAMFMFWALIIFETDETYYSIYDVAHAAGVDSVFAIFAIVALCLLTIDLLVRVSVPREMLKYTKLTFIPSIIANVVLFVSMMVCSIVPVASGAKANFMLLITMIDMTALLSIIIAERILARRNIIKNQQ